jgi:hypothetical protein
VTFGFERAAPLAPGEAGLERTVGLEPTSTVWKTVALPLSYAREIGALGRIRTCIAPFRRRQLCPLSNEGMTRAWRPGPGSNRLVALLQSA